MTHRKKSDYKKAIKKAQQNIVASLPIMLSTLLLVNLITVLVHNHYEQIFRGKPLIDALIGAIAGSISFGMPITSYIIGGELLQEGINLIAITAFMMAWTTVGVFMLPMEAQYLGTKFAIMRNIINFIFSIIIAFSVVATMHFLSYTLL